MEATLPVPLMASDGGDQGWRFGLHPLPEELGWFGWFGWFDGFDGLVSVQIHLRKDELHPWSFGSRTEKQNARVRCKPPKPI
jgi:hypothetical protein